MIEKKHELLSIYRGYIMSILYDQILKNNDIIQAQDKRYPSKMLFDNLIQLLKNNEFTVVKLYSNSKSPIDALVMRDNDTFYRLVVYMKNITGAGWEDKKYRKRVQVTNVRFKQPNQYISTNEHQAMFILGYYNFDNNPIYVAWDLYRYTNHNTNRSCYVSVSHLLSGYETGYYQGVSAENIIWVFKEQYFSKFINDYIKYIMGFRQ